MNEEAIKKLNEVLSYVKSTFVGKDDIVDLLGIGLAARENAFLLGPPGTAKSAIVKLLSQCVVGGINFEYLLTRFTEPSEIFGPMDIRKLKEGKLVTNIEGMMPEASLVFLDEIFNANSAILNSLLMALNERIYRKGKDTIELPTLMFVGASNQLPEEETLEALLDRFLIRIQCNYVSPDLLEEVLLAGWKIQTQIEHSPSITSDEIREIQKQTRQVDLSPTANKYVDLIHTLRNIGIKISDRRAVKIQNLLAASAILSGRLHTKNSDLWVLKHIWDTEEQMEVLSGIINKVIENEDKINAHPQAFSSVAPNAEKLAEEINRLKQKWEEGSLSFEEQNIIKDKLRYMQTQCSWIKNSENKQFLETEIETLWQKILQTL